MISPQWLRTFVALAELGNFTRAAERLDLTQAAVSQHIQRLELLLGPLLIRRPRQVELTPAGLALLAYSEEMAAADQRLQESLCRQNAEQGEVSLITPGSIGLTLYPRLLELQREFPGLSVRHRFAPADEVVRAVLANQAELGIVSLKPDEPRLQASLFAQEALELVVPAEAVVTGWEDLQRLGFIDHPDGQAMAGRLLARRYPGSPGVRSLPCHGFTNQIGLILEPVARGLGFTVLPRFARQAFARPEAIKVVVGAPQVVDDLWLLHRAEWPLSARAQRVVSILAAQLKAEDTSL